MPQALQSYAQGTLSGLSRDTELQSEVGQRSLLAADAEVTFKDPAVPRSEFQRVQRSANDGDLRLLLRIVQQAFLRVFQQRPFNSPGEFQEGSLREEALTLVVAERQRPLCLAEQLLAGTPKRLRQARSRAAPGPGPC